MQVVVVDGIDIGSIARAVDAATYTRGVDYLRQRAVLHMAWIAERNVVQALVRGSSSSYATEAHFVARQGGWLDFSFGHCSCPVGADCKHVVAVALMVAGGSGASSPPHSTSAVPTWERELSSLLGQPPGAGQSADDVPLAIELTVATAPAVPVRYAAAPAGPKILARMVRPGRNGGWVAGGLNWGKLEASYAMVDHVASHVQLLRELYVLHRTWSGVPSRRCARRWPPRVATTGFATPRWSEPCWPNSKTSGWTGSGRRAGPGWVGWTRCGSPPRCCRC